MPFQNTEMEGNIGHGLDGIFVLVTIQSCHHKNKDKVQTCVRAMVDTGSTYNIISLECLMNTAVVKNPFSKQSNTTNTPTLVLGDGNPRSKS